MFFRLLVEFLQIIERQVGLFAFTQMQFQLGDQHAKLGAPVAHMILADNIVPLIFQQTRQAVTNNGGAQMADVHFFG